MTADKLAAALASLRTSGAERQLGEYLTSALPASTPDGDLLLAVDRPGVAHLLLPLPAGAWALEDKASAGVQLTGARLLEGSAARHFSVLRCSEQSLEGTWLHLVQEILDSLATDGRRADAVARAALGRWRELLERAPAGPLSRSMLAGLFGELTFLERLSKKRHGLEVWTGPLGQRHDFRIGAMAFEVKTTLANDSELVHVNGITQLETPVDGPLYLVRLRAEAATSGLSVPDLVGRCTDGGLDSLALRTLLRAAGYSDADASSYQAQRFEVRATDVWHVASGFPCLTSASFAGAGVPPGISGIEYQLDLSAADAFRLPHGRFEEIIRGLESGRDL